MLLAKWMPRKVDFEQREVGRNADSCTEAINFLFERGVARTRPHARNWYSEFTAAHIVDYAKSFVLNQGNRYTLYIDSANSALIRFASTDSSTSHSKSQITGAGLTFGNRLYHNMIVASGDIVIGNHPGGMVTHTPLSTTTYTITSGAKYRYFTTSFNRVVGAYDITAGANNPRSIGWSTTTDITDWTSTGAGSTELTDIPDDITGLKSVNNVVVVARQTGWTLGYVTGSNTTGPFRWNLMVRDGAGCAWPATLDNYNNTLYCVGHDDVYQFDINQGAKPIGAQIREPLMRSISKGARYKGVITKGDFLYEPGAETVDGVQNNFVPRVRYHLVPVVPSEGARHYSFDLKDQSWSSHSYNFRINEAWEYVRDIANHPIWSLSFASAATDPEHISWWDGAAGARYAADATPTSWPDEIVDQDHVLVSPTFILGDTASRDMNINRLMLVWALEANVGGEEFPKVKLVATVQQEYKQVQVEQSLDLAEKIDARSGEWNRSWFNVRLVGNLLKLQLVVPAGLKLAIKDIEVHGDDSNVARAA